MNQEELETLLNGLKVLKDKHFYKEVATELKELYASDQFGQFDTNNQTKILRLLAESIYQDKQLPSSVRFDEALEYLNELEENAETLSLKGAVYKRKYQLYKNILDLYEAIGLYEKAALEYRFIHTNEQTISKDDQGYGAVNAIYLCKLLLKDFDKDLDSGTKKQYKEKYEKLIDETIEHIEKYKNLFSKENPWVYPTLSELYFNKSDYATAKQYLVYETNDEDTKKLEKLSSLSDINDQTQKAIKRASNIETQSREKLVIAEQLIRLYKLDKVDEKISDKDKKILGEFFENFIKDKEKVKNIINSMLIGKLGLALSGGGFRASLFHLGVFARLAELDMLKNISVISSVSGGSITAMHYYIKLKELLETKANDTIVQEDYIILVKQMQKEFLAGIQTNIRMKTFEEYNPLKETITQRLGELYQKELFDKACKSTVTLMKELYIFPKINDKQLKNFNPHFNNLELNCKVPILAINATCLNSGHNWRFTASGMGESQYMYDTTIDKNTVHKYARYEEFENDKFKNFKISDAVVSSSCVPGLFDPIELQNAYKSDETIKLVDGGIYDNQGLATLLDEECNLIICSDAAGQFDDENDPSSSRLSTLVRMNSALMDRGRDQGYEILKEYFKNKKVEGICMIHLKQCFDTKEYSPKNRCELASQSSLCKCADLYETIDKDIQKALINVRTDLDAFSDKEAYALEYSGYTLMSKWFDAVKSEQKIWQIYNSSSSYEWDFLKIKSVIKEDKKTLLKQLQVSQNIFFKYNPFKSSIKCIIIFCLSLILLLAIVWKFYTVMVTISFLGILLYLINNKFVYILLKFAMKPVLWLVAKFNLKCLNNRYLEEGKI